MDDLPPPKLHVRLPSSLLPLASALLPRTVFRVVDRWFRCRNSRRAGEVAAWRVWPLLLKIPARARQYLWYLILERYSMTTCSLTSSSKFSTPAATKPKETRSCDTLEICVQTNMSAAAREVQASPRKGCDTSRPFIDPLFFQLPLRPRSRRVPPSRNQRLFSFMARFVRRLKLYPTQT